jgi:hypothetical protein
MIRIGRNRRLAPLVAVALAAIAVLALPSMAAAKHHHGHSHHRRERRHLLVLGGEESAGKIKSFDPASGRLVIALANEETVGGLVTEATEIECGHGSATASDMGAGGDEGGDGPGEHEGGEEAGEDDHPGPKEAGDDDSGEEEAGDEHGGEGGGEHGEPSTGESGCTTADLTEGAIVKEAELKLEGGGATFEKVELAG